MNRKRGTFLALLAAVLFGAGTPLVKLRFSGIDLLLLAALINIGSGLGVALLTRVAWHPAKLLEKRNRLHFAASVGAGGIAGPFLLIWGIAHLPGSAAALLLNTEAAFTALIAHLVFRDHVGPRLVFGVAVLSSGGVVISLSNANSGTGSIAACIAITAACLCWAIDSNCTGRLREVTAPQFTVWKGILSGAVLLGASLLLEKSPLPSMHIIAEALLLGTFCSGIALLCYVIAMQNLGVARSSAYAATAPFVGAAMSVVLLGDAVTIRLIVAAVLMAGGVFALMTERAVEK